jgi:hypothetical protein
LTLLYFLPNFCAVKSGIDSHNASEAETGKRESDIEDRWALIGTEEEHNSRNNGNAERKAHGAESSEAVREHAGRETAEHVEERQKGYDSRSLLRREAHHLLGNRGGLGDDHHSGESAADQRHKH